MVAEKETIPKRIREVSRNYRDLTAILSKDKNSVFQIITYGEFYTFIKAMGLGLCAVGVARGDHVGIISDNRKEWIITDIALLGLGAVDVPRGSDSTDLEISYILRHADCKLSFAENKTQTEKILSRIKEIPLLKTIIIFEKDYDDAFVKAHPEVRILDFESVLASGKKELAAKPDFFDGEVDKGTCDDLATLIYTSGTTGEPKGVMLSHRNFIFQLERVYEHINVQPEHIFISVLPVWHSFERAVEYVILNRAAAIAYSKPIGKIMLEDMEKVKPQWMASVPRIWEGIRAAVYKNASKESGVKKALFHFFVNTGQSFAVLTNMLRGLVPTFRRRVRFLDILISFIPWLLLAPLKGLGNLLVFKKLKTRLGGRFIAGISGGGALPAYVDRFFQAAGILLLEGYGLTETAPILSVRLQKHPVATTVGPIMRDVEFKILDKDGNSMPPGRKGVLFVKSEQIMKGYYKRQDKTEEVLKDGWLNTGDIVVSTHKRELKILGREKETIVLMGGENIEPVPIEDKMQQSEYIDQVMIVGQDQKFLAALIVPNMEKLEEAARERNLPYIDMEELIASMDITELINAEIQNLINSKNGFKIFERIYKFKLLSKPFEVGKEMTASLKIKRNIVNDIYKKDIQKLFI